MKKWYSNLNADLKTSLWSGIVVLVATLATLPLMIINLLDIPLGILLGGFLNTLYYFVSGLNRNRGESKSALKFDAALIIIRFTLFAALGLVIGWLYFKMNIKIFNLFAFVGAYLFPIFIFMLLSRKEVKQ